MHLEGPWLSTTGKRKGKIKFRNSAEARKARESDESWKALQKKWGIEQEERKRKHALAAPVWTEQPKVNHRETPRIPSLNGGVDMSPAVKAPNKIYTGTKILGISQMAKSNAVPVFNSEHIIEIARMRR